jgi:hypothetical protein
MLRIEEGRKLHKCNVCVHIHYAEENLSTSFDCDVKDIDIYVDKKSLDS